MSIEEMQNSANRLRAAGKKIGFVPTMGFLHQGHLSLLEEAKTRSDIVVMSIYVNPTQFAPNEDFEAYPRDTERDCKLASQHGCDIVFIPESDQIYPEPYLTYVEVEKMTRILCGASRPAHFRGVTTIVAKLFNIVKPQLAVFGQKDYQQALVIQQMTRDLNFDVEIVIAPIVRESDGLAMSSRNSYLSPDERQQALVLNRSLLMAKQEILSGERDAESLKRKIRANIRQKPAAEIDYVEIVDARNLDPVKDIQHNVLIALAAKFGKTRLIDNIIVDVEKLI